MPGQGLRPRGKARARPDPDHQNLTMAIRPQFDPRKMMVKAVEAMRRSINEPRDDGKAPRPVTRRCAHELQSRQKSRHDASAHCVSIEHFEHHAHTRRTKKPSILLHPVDYGGQEPGSSNMRRHLVGRLFLARKQRKGEQVFRPACWSVKADRNVRPPLGACRYPFSLTTCLPQHAIRDTKTVKRR